MESFSIIVVLCYGIIEGKICWGGGGKIVPHQNTHNVQIWPYIDLFVNYTSSLLCFIQ